MICVDTTCIIDFFKNDAGARRIIDSIKDDICTTEITRFEMFFGIHRQEKIRPDEAANTRLFFDEIDVLPFNEPCGELAGEILGSLMRKGMVIDQTDAMIAATMLQHGCNTIVTKNTKHFSRIQGIHVIDY